MKVVELRLPGSATSRYLLNLVPDLVSLVHYCAQARMDSRSQGDALHSESALGVPYRVNFQIFAFFYCNFISVKTEALNDILKHIDLPTKEKEKVNIALLSYAAG